MRFHDGDLYEPEEACRDAKIDEAKAVLMDMLTVAAEDGNVPAKWRHASTALRRSKTILVFGGSLRRF